jgi:hypothetical protein
VPGNVFGDKESKASMCQSIALGRRKRSVTTMQEVKEHVAGLCEGAIINSDNRRACAINYHLWVLKEETKISLEAMDDDIQSLILRSDWTLDKISNCHLRSQGCSDYNSFVLSGDFELLVSSIHCPT